MPVMHSIMLFVLMLQVMMVGVRLKLGWVAASTQGDSP
jgi:hypothetical protein